MRDEVGKFRARTKAPISLAFFAHTQLAPDNAREALWRDRLKPYYKEFGLDPNASVPAPARAPFNDEACALVEELKPEVASFHFGLPAPALLKRVKAVGCKVISSATTVAEARWLEERGVDAIIAQGAEAGGHRGIFLSDDISTQAGTFALVPQVVDAVKVPVIAAGGVTDARGIAAAFALGAAGVQLGTAYLHCPESKISQPHRDALKNAQDNSTTLTNVMSGRPARGVVNRLIREQGPFADVPAFPYAANAIAPVRAAAEKRGSGDFSPLSVGQAAALGRALPAGELTKRLAAEALERLRGLSG
ncbi:MAG: nitronate monooxygenase family protein [Xanthobacteraceae bacterium]